MMLEAIERLRGEIRDDLERTGGSSTSVRSERVFSALGEIERELTERYVPFPVDADGVVWTYVDEWFVDKHGEKHAMEGMKIDCDGEWMLRSPWGWYLASECRHVRPCTIKEVLVEYRNALDDNYNSHVRPVDEIDEEYTDKLRELLGGDAS